MTRHVHSLCFLMVIVILAAVAGVGVVPVESRGGVLTWFSSGGWPGLGRGCGGRRGVWCGTGCTGVQVR